MLHRIYDDRPSAEMGGRRFGPFANAAQADEWRRYVMQAGLLPVTADEVFSGRVECDGLHLFVPDAWELGMHPTVEVYDHYIQDDNGRLVIELPRSARSLHRDTVLLAEGNARVVEPVRGQCLPLAVRAPVTWDTSPSDVRDEMEMPAGLRGGLAVLQSHLGGPLEWLVCWRADGRRTRELPVLSGHPTEQFARMEACRRLRDFEPPPPPRPSSRVRDYQLSRVYLWEIPFSSPEPLGGVADAQARIDTIWRELGLEKPPPVSVSPRLELHSYFSPRRGIVLAEGWGLTVGVLLHEAAHAVRWAMRGAAREAPHGPEFMATLMAVLERFGGEDAAAMSSRASELGVDVGETPLFACDSRARGRCP
jgi:hypothetical protein